MTETQQTILDIANFQIARNDIEITDHIHSIFDSLEYVEFIMRIEHKFDLDVDDHDFCEIQSFADLANIVARDKVEATL